MAAKAATAATRRWAGRLARLGRAAAWAAKAALAAVAVAAVVAWPWSYSRPQQVWLVQHFVTDAEARTAYVYGEYREGRMAFGHFSSSYAGEYAFIGREYARRVAAGWRVDPWPQGREFSEPSSNWGPIGWNAFDAPRTDLGKTRWALSLPLWLVACVAGAWPAGSVGLRLRRRRRLRRAAAAAGHCPHCGYDCRATPAAGGPRLATCPECGRATEGKAEG